MFYLNRNTDEWSSVGLMTYAAVHLRTIKPSASDFERKFFDCIVNTYATEMGTRRFLERASTGLKPFAAVH